jgi:hypothetical protein
MEPLVGITLPYHRRQHHVSICRTSHRISNSSSAFQLSTPQLMWPCRALGQVLVEFGAKRNIRDAEDKRASDLVEVRKSSSYPDHDGDGYDV